MRLSKIQKLEDRSLKFEDYYLAVQRSKFPLDGDFLGGLN